MNSLSINVKKKRVWAISERITNKVNFIFARKGLQMSYINIPTQNII